MAALLMLVDGVGETGHAKVNAELGLDPHTGAADCLQASSPTSPGYRTAARVT